CRDVAPQGRSRHRGALLGARARPRARREGVGRRRGRVCPDARDDPPRDRPCGADGRRPRDPALGRAPQSLRRPAELSAGGDAPPAPRAPRAGGRALSRGDRAHHQRHRRWLEEYRLIAMDIGEILARAPVIPVLTVVKLAHAVPLARALVAGGLGVLEITLRTPCPLGAIEAMRAAVPDAIVGVGTLTRPEELAQAERAGAQFGVSPGFAPELAAAARAVRYPLLPGIMTPS